MANGDYTKQVTINASRESVFNVLTTLEGLESWWENSVKGDPKKNGKLHFEFSDSDEYSQMHVDEATHSVVQWSVVKDTGYDGEWEGTKIRFEMEEVGPKTTKLIFRHVGLTPELSSYEGCVGGWEYFIGNIVSQSEKM